ncbi:hypothetical protein LCGC14_0278260 [marine sediment metagenome]|uniref:Uncharacterized protein n=1 Tax=marine sediment metagenome TaxID=412755 RepID=A0A0F9X238_9ZZZZ
MTSKNRITVHLFHTTDRGAIIRTVKNIILFNTPYQEIPSTIDKIVMEFYSTYDFHEIKTITSIKDEIYVNGGLI